MANSRLERIGTIYSRITGLLRSEAVKMENKPIWYDVYQNFPPKYPPKFDRPTPNTDLPKIFYPEDKIRAKIKKEHKSLIGPVNLSDNNRTTNTQKCIAYYRTNIESGMSEEEAFQGAVDKVISEIPIRRSGENDILTNKVSLAEEFQRSKQLMKDIFK